MHLSPQQTLGPQGWNKLALLAAALTLVVTLNSLDRLRLLILGEQQSLTGAGLTLPWHQASAQLDSQQQNNSLLALKGSVCEAQQHTDYNWGEPVGPWGFTHHVESAQACCLACQRYHPATSDDLDCTVWVWCGDQVACGTQYRECWLKHLAYPEAAAPREGIDVPWTSGVRKQAFDSNSPEKAKESRVREFHVVISAEGPAVHWQARVHYYHYRKVKQQCEMQLRCEMGGFTRLLHSGKPDDLMAEIPSFVVNPLPADQHDHKGYVVLNRPYAFVQWTQTAEIKERYVLMSEPDHLWLKPMPNLMQGEHPAAFPFFYIEPAKREYVHITEKFTGHLSRNQAEEIAPIGSSPTLLSFNDLQRVSALWMNISLQIFYDEEASKEWGWVQEMYAFTIACYKAGIKRIDLHRKLMAQPPWDAGLVGKSPFYILHYTYGMDYTKDGKFTPGKYGDWRFDKRTYATRPPPRHLGEPPPGMDNDLVRHLVHAINEASDAIPGWDEYAATGQAKQIWNGVLA